MGIGDEGQAVAAEVGGGEDAVRPGARCSAAGMMGPWALDRGCRVTDRERTCYMESASQESGDVLGRTAVVDRRDRIRRMGRGQRGHGR